MEIGAGLGLAGCCVSKYCKASKVALTDSHEKVLQVLEAVCMVNFHSDRRHRSSGRCIKVGLLDWVHMNTSPNIDIADYDTIIASDIVRVQISTHSPWFATVDL